MSNFVEIRPRELKPALLELDGISRTTIEAHYRLYQGYVAKRNEILGQARDRRSRRREPGLLRDPRAEGRPDLRGRRASRTTRSTSSTSAAAAAIPTARSARSSSATSARPTRGAPTCARPGMAGRGWAWTAFDWDEGRLFNYVGDAQNTFPVWNATPLVALDVYEHAYFLDYQTDRAAYIEAFLAEPRLGRRERLGLARTASRPRSGRLGRPTQRPRSGRSGVVPRPVR